MDVEWRFGMEGSGMEWVWRSGGVWGVQSGVWSREDVGK